MQSGQPSPSAASAPSILAGSLLYPVTDVRESRKPPLLSFSLVLVLCFVLIRNPGSHSQFSAGGKPEQLWQWPPELLLVKHVGLGQAESR